MKEEAKKMILLIVICIITLYGLYMALRLNEKRKEELLNTSEINEYLTEIKYEELQNYLVEQPNIVVYVSNSGEKTTDDFDKKIISVIRKYNLENDIIYINIKDTNIVDPLYQNAPVLIFYENNEVKDIIACNTLKNSKDIIEVLEERSVIND